MTRPTVFVVDDDDSVRRALTRLLLSAGYHGVPFPSAEAFLAHPPATGPSCAVVDLRLPGLDGLALQRSLSGRGDRLPVVFVTGHGDIPTTVHAMKLGAEDFLAKPFGEGEFLAAVARGVRRHATALAEEADRAEVRGLADTLSPRECEVMALVVLGLPNKTIGARLGVCEKTVKVHRGNVMRKMRAGSLPALVRLAAKLGLAGEPEAALTAR